MRLALALASAIAAMACTPAQYAEIATIYQDVAAGLAQGDSDPELASIVCRDLGGTTSTDAVCADAPTILNEVVLLLEDTGLLTGKAKANADAYIARKAAAK